MAQVRSTLMAKAIRKRSTESDLPPGWGYPGAGLMMEAVPVAVVIYS